MSISTNFINFVKTNEKNRNKYLDALDSEIELFNELDSLYLELESRILPITKTNEILFLLNRLSHNYFYISIQQYIEGHYVNHLATIRTAIDITLTALLIYNSPEEYDELKKIYFSGFGSKFRKNLSDEDIDKFSKNFRYLKNALNQRFGNDLKTGPLTSYLLDKYDRLSPFCHGDPTILVFKNRINDDKLHNTYFFNNQSEKWIRYYFCMSIRDFIKMLNQHFILLTSITNSKEDEFFRKLSALESKLNQKMDSLSRELKEDLEEISE